MTDVEAALAAMRAAEHEARRVDDPTDARLIVRWSRDRLRLIERDRETLERHAQSIGVCRCLSLWPCLDARAVIDHWTEDA